MDLGRWGLVPSEPPLGAASVVLHRIMAIGYDLTMSDETDPEVGQVIYIPEAAELLHRRMGTLRKWERLGVLPDHLMPKRGFGGRQWRYWTPSQIEGIREWIAETDRRPGKGLPHYQPDGKKLDAAIEKMRKPRTADG